MANLFSEGIVVAIVGLLGILVTAIFGYRKAKATSAPPEMAMTEIDVMKQNALMLR